MGWQEDIVAKVAAKPRNHESTRTPFGPALKPLQFAATVAFMRYINGAAHQMGVNRSTYVRRALSVHAAHVLRMDVRLILFETPTPLNEGVQHLPHEKRKGLRDLGEGIEAWCPHPGCDGDHLRVPNSGQGAGLP
jgi:hypothetical protein